jgi:hypothetical protein
MPTNPNREAPVDERFAELFRRQLASGFEDVRGADASITLPVSERLLNEVIARTIPRSAPVRELHVKPEAGNRFLVRARIGSSPLLPPISLTLSIDRQPEFPASPVLILRLQMSGLLSLAGPALRFMNALPPGIRVEHDRVYVDLPTLLETRHLASYLDYVKELRVNTLDGTVVLSIRAGI